MPINKLKLTGGNQVFHSHLELDGKLFPYTSINISGKINECFKVEVGFLVKEIELDIEALVKLKPELNAIVKESIDNKIKEEIEKASSLYETRQS